MVFFSGKRDQTRSECSHMDQFLTLANSAWILSRFLQYLQDSSYIYFAPFSGVGLLLCTGVTLSWNAIACLLESS